MNHKLDGKVALITGASRGLGRAIAWALGQAGARVALVARNQVDLEKVALEMHGHGIEAGAFVTDVTREDQVAALEKEVISRFHTVDILVNNAGINIRKPVTDFTLEEWNRVLHTNLTGPFLMCRAFVPHMKGKRYGRIINLTSIMSHIALPGRTAYAATKTGLLGFTRALALELAPEGITVNGISPGVIATEMNQVILDNPELSQEFMAKIPLRRWGEPDEIGQLALYLCSEAASFVTGTDIVIDGGWMAQ